MGVWYSRLAPAKNSLVVSQSLEQSGEEII